MARTARFVILVVLLLPTFGSNFATLTSMFCTNLVIHLKRISVGDVEILRAFRTVSKNHSKCLDLPTESTTPTTRYLPLLNSKLS